MNHKLATGIILFLIFIVCVGIGNYLYKINEISNTKIERITEVSSEKISDECTDEYEELIQTNSSEKKVSPNAIFVYEIEYKKCGHMKKEYVAAPGLAINRTEKEIKEMFFEWNIEYFSNDEVILKKTEDRYCNEHYILRDEEGQIAVYKVDADGNEEVYERTGIIIKYLPDEDKQKIQDGIFINGIQALNKMLENYE